LSDQNENLWKQLENALAARSTQDQVTWSIFGIFWASNALLLVAIFTSQGKYAITIVSLIGVFTCCVWFILVHRALGHIKEYEAVMSGIEDILLKDRPAFRLTLPPNTKSKISGSQARVVMRWAIAIFLGIWIVGLSISLRLLLYPWL
jgi:hypothetical protein